MREIHIAGKIISYDLPAYVIAEAGVNHNGKLDLAMKLVDAAANAGADAVKFQTFRAEEVVTGQGKMAPYQKRNLGYSESQIQMLRKLGLPEKFYPKIITHCRKRKITFLSTPHGGFRTVDFLQKLGVPAFKFASNDLTNLPVLEYAAKFRKPMILGTGMANDREILEALRTIKKYHNKIILLHCTTNYPCPPAEVNLKAMQTMMKKLHALVGYSDHSLGIQVPIMAATLGAAVIEKHFTLDKKMKGPDHVASLEPRELKKMVKAVKQTKIILGSGVKKPFASELKMAKMMRRSVVSKVFIPAGKVIARTDLEIKRPGTGLAPKYFFKIIGKTAKRDIEEDTLIKKGDYEN